VRKAFGEMLLALLLLFSVVH